MCADVTCEWGNEACARNVGSLNAPVAARPVATTDSRDGPRPLRGADCKNLPYLSVRPRLSDLLSFGLWQVPKLLEPFLLVP